MADLISLRISKALSLSSLIQPIIRTPMSAMPSKVLEEEWLHTDRRPSAAP